MLLQGTEPPSHSATGESGEALTECCSFLLPRFTSLSEGCLNGEDRIVQGRSSSYCELPQSFSRAARTRLKQFLASSLSPTA